MILAVAVFLISASTYGICKKTGHTKKLECTEVVTGTVTSVGGIMEDVGGQIIYADYVIDGEEYHAKGGASWLEGYYEIGDSVPIHYNRYKVSEAFVGAPAANAYCRVSIVFMIASGMLMLSLGVRSSLRSTFM